MLDAQDICVLELVEIRAKLSEQHSVAVRQERDAAVSRAQHIGRQKARVNDAISAAQKERLHKVFPKIMPRVPRDKTSIIIKL